MLSDKNKKSTNNTIHKTAFSQAKSEFKTTKKEKQIMNSHVRFEQSPSNHAFVRWLNRNKQEIAQIFHWNQTSMVPKEVCGIWHLFKGFRSFEGGPSLVAYAAQATPCSFGLRLSFLHSGKWRIVTTVKAHNSNLITFPSYVQSYRSRDGGDVRDCRRYFRVALVYRIAISEWRAGFTLK